MLETLDSLVSQVQLVQLEALEVPANVVHKDSLASEVRMVPREIVAGQDNLDDKAQRVPRGQMASKAPLVSLVSQDR